MSTTPPEPPLPVFRFELMQARGGWLLQSANGAVRHFHHTHGALGAALLEADGAHCIIIARTEGFVRVVYDSERDALHHRNK
jgi:hypothetical protein